MYYNQDYLGWEQGGIGRMLVFLTLQGFVLWIFIFSYEYGLIQKVNTKCFSLPLTNKQLKPNKYSEVGCGQVFVNKKLPVSLNHNGN